MAGGRLRQACADPGGKIAQAARRRADDELDRLRRRKCARAGATVMPRKRPAARSQGRVRRESSGPYRFLPMLFSASAADNRGHYVRANLGNRRSALSRSIACSSSGRKPKPPARRRSAPSCRAAPRDSRCRTAPGRPTPASSGAEPFGAGLLGDVIIELLELMPGAVRKARIDRGRDLREPRDSGRPAAARRCRRARRCSGYRNSE